MSSFSLPCPTPTTCREHCCGGWCVPRAALAQERAEPVAWRCACGANLYIDEYGHPASRAVPVSYGQTLEEAMRETREKAQAYEAGWKAGLAHQAEPVEPVAWSGYDLDGMVEAFSRVIEAHYQRANPFQNPIDMDAQMALRALRGFIPAMKAYTAPPQRVAQQAEPVQDQRCRAEPRSDGDFVCDCKIGECPGRSAALAQQAEPLNLSDPAIQKRLASQWGYVPAAAQAEPVEPVAGRAFLERILAAMEGVIDVADRKTDEFDALRSCVIDLTVMLHTAPPQRDALLQALQNLVSVCQRMDLEHQAERPSEAEYQTAMQAAQAAIQAVEGAA